MSNCADFERLMEGMVAGDYDPGAGGAHPRWADTARRNLLAHVEGCAACKDLYGFHEWLAREAPGLEAPEPRELEAVRRNVLAWIREEAPAPAAQSFPWWRRLVPVAAAGAPSASGALRLVLAGAAAALLLVGGVFIGRTTFRGAGDAGGEAIARSSGLPGQGLTGDAIESMGALPYSFTNVSVEPAGANLVRLTFDMTRRVRTERPQDDPLVREALKQSLRGASPLGDRLRALTLAGDMMDAEIREALIDSMRGDASVAVRLRALETLSRYPADPDIQQAMLSVLTEEESVQMRLLAIDYLGASRVPHDRILTAIEETPPGGAEALLVRATERLGL